MSRKKLKRFKEMKEFPNVFNYPVEMKGRWRSDYFKNENPVVLELGCGRGEYTVGLSSIFPEKNFIGVDLKGSRLWRGAKTCYLDGKNNAAFIRSRIELIEYYFDKNEVDEIWITFPDPQPKDKWEKKRLTSENYLNFYRRILKPWGIIHLKTDSTYLYEFTLTLLKYLHLPILESNADIYSDENVTPALSIQTTYEKKFRATGEKIKYLQFQLPDLILPLV
jgi:tRNA (guanine-N7-)-methyltransferase